MKSRYRTFYILSLAVIILLSVYPIYMGISVMSQYLQNGYVPVESYPKYIIPYTPISIAVIVSAALLPVIYRLSKRFSLIIDSCIGIGLFFILELCFEKIKVIEGYTTFPIESWQYGICAATPEVLRAIGEPIYAENNQDFKVHFYLISIVIILSTVGVLYGFLKLFKEDLYQKKKTLIVQTVCVTVFLGLCIFACFTAFYRNGTLYISPISAFLTGLFFIVFGVTFGMYIASHLYGKGKAVSVLIPALTAVLTTLAMYIGELVLMDGKLYVLGKGLFFQPLGASPFSLCDISIILISGIITALLAFLLNRTEGQVHCQE